jgi:hypothetical protein
MSAAPSPAFEADLFVRYLTGAPASPEIAGRYGRACSILFTEPAPPEDERLVTFALRHPSLVPCLDAAAALVRPGSLLRRKILVMASILEATPQGAKMFLPRARSPVGTILAVLRASAATVIHTGAGLLLLAIAQRARP